MAKKRAEKPTEPLAGALARYLEVIARLRSERRGSHLSRLAIHHAPPAARSGRAQAVRAASNRRAHAGREHRATRSRRQMQVLRDNGFGSATKFLHRRRVVRSSCAIRATRSRATTARCWTSSREALKRFATGTYAVWYPNRPAVRGARSAAAWQDDGHQSRQAMAACHAHGQVQQDHHRATGATHGQACPPAGCS